MRAFLVTPGFEAALRAEVEPWLGPPREAEATGSGPYPGLVLFPEGAGPPLLLDPVFARQQLVAARLLRAASVAQLAEAAFTATEAAVDASESLFTVHAWASAEAGAGGLSGRAALLGEAVVGLLRERRRRAWRRFRAWTELGAGRRASLVVQIVLVERAVALAAATAPRPLPRGGTDLSPWPAGCAPIGEEDRQAPSRAYRKLEEAFRWMGAEPKPGQSCVDLGGSPGGWAWTALKRGASVTAVDRAPLRRPAAGHPRLKMLVGNAFTFEPGGARGPRPPVDWLLCDVICEPARTIALVDRWLEHGWCRRLVATVKFKGKSGYGVLAELPPLFARHACREARVKHLAHNHNEVTVMLRR